LLLGKGDALSTLGRYTIDWKSCNIHTFSSCMERNGSIIYEVELHSFSISACFLRLLIPHVRFGNTNYVVRIAIA